MTRNPVITAALLASVGCQAQFNSEEGQWAFTAAELVSEPHTGFGDDQSVVEDTLVCASPHWQGEEISGWDAEALFDQCVEQELSDGGEIALQEEAATCLLLEDPGEVTWSLNAEDCDAPFTEGDAPVDDRVVFEVVALDDVSAHVDQWPERKALDGLDLEPPGVLTDAILVSEGEAFRLLEDAEVYLFLRAWDEGRQQPAAWYPDDGEVTVDSLVGDVQVLSAGLDPGWVGLKLGPDAVAELSLEIRGQRMVAGTVQAVSADELASLDVVAGFISHREGTDERTPWAARAVVLDAEGRPVFGTPVSWSVEGPPMVLEPGPHSSTRFPGGDYAWIEDGCTPPAKQLGERTATLSASYEELSDSLELTWTVTEDMVDLEADWSADDRCGGGCAGCASGGGAGGLAWVLGLLAGALGLRRRR